MLLPTLVQKFDQDNAVFYPSEQLRISIKIDNLMSIDVDSMSNLLISWVTMCAYYSNWSSEAYSMVTLLSGQFHRSSWDPDLEVAEVKQLCKASLEHWNFHAQNGAPIHIQAWSDDGQCPGLFGLAKLRMLIQETSLILEFNPYFLDKQAAYLLLDGVIFISKNLESGAPEVPHWSGKIRDLIKNITFFQSDAQLIGNVRGLPKQSILAQLKFFMEHRPEKIAIQDNGSSLSYKQLFQRVEHLRKKLEEHGVSAGSCVALEIPRSQQFIICALSVLSLEGIYVPVDPALPLERKTLMLNGAKITWSIDENEKIISRAAFCKPSPLNAGVKGGGYALFTSGTTGLPKGVLISSESLLYYANTAKHLFNITEYDRVLQFSPVSFDASVEEIYPCLLAGGTLVIRDETVDLRPKNFLHFVEHHGITFLDLPTGYWREITTACLTDHLKIPVCVQRIVIGGESLYESDIKTWYQLAGPRPILMNTYGPTETTVITTTHVVRPVQSEVPSRNLVSIGSPIPGSRLILLDRFDNPVPFGGMGQLCISSPGVAIGYLENPVLTEEKFFSRKECDGTVRRYYKSGDLARIGSDGTVEYHGRMDNIVKRQGFRFSLGEIESTLRSMPEISDCAVFMSKHGAHAKLICVIQLSADKQVSVSVLRQHFKQELPVYMHPNVILFTEKLPRTLFGKTDYSELQTYASARIDEPGNAIEDKLISGLHGIFGGMFDLDASLIENGADSLQVVRLSMFLEQHTGREWSISRLYQYENLRTLLSDSQTVTECPAIGASFISWRDVELKRLQTLLRTQSQSSSEPAGQGILISGVTGLLGRHLLQALLRSTHRPIYCLIRPTSNRDGQARLDQLMQDLNLDANARAQVHLIAGDLVLDGLGIRQKRLNELRTKVGDVIHCAADTNMVAPYAGLVDTNVIGSINLINLALESRAKFHFVSSLALFDGAEAGVIQEKNIHEVQELSSGYLQTKWMVEALLDKLASFQHQVIIYRCGRLWGSTHRLEEAHDDYIYQFLGLCLRMNQFPNVPMQLEVSPVDLVAKRIVQTVMRQKSHRALAVQIHHLNADRSYGVNEVFHAMKKKMPSVNLVQPEVWLGSLREAVQKNEDDVQVLKFYTVIKSSPLTAFIDNLQIQEETALENERMGITPAEMINAVLKKHTMMEGSPH